MIDAWSGPTPSPQQFPHHEQNGIRKLLDKIAALELRVKESTSNLLRTAGIRLTKLGMFIDSSLTVDGSLDTTGDTTIGGTLEVTGPTTLGGATTVSGNTSVSGSLGVTGPMTVGGTLSLPAGIINNAALANQVLGAVAPAVTQTGWATTTSLVTKATTTVTTPAGFTSALVTALGMVVFQDSAPNRFDSRCVIEGAAGPTILSLAANAGSASPSQTRVVSVTGGQVLNIDVQVFSAVATGGMAANQAVITASVVFLR